VAVGHDDTGHELVLAVVAGNISTANNSDQGYSSPLVTLVSEKVGETLMDPHIVDVI
jgi:hypothetical protein